MITDKELEKIANELVSITEKELALKLTPPQIELENIAVKLIPPPLLKKKHKRYESPYKYHK